MMADLASLLESDSHNKENIQAALEEGRARTKWLLDEIPKHHLTEQILPFLSPPLWDFNHMANVEEQWLACEVGGMAPVDAQHMDTYNMMLHPRAKRGALPLPDIKGTHAYWNKVRQRTLECLENCNFDCQYTKEAYIWWNIINHEHQHQETVLQSMDRYDDYTPSIMRPHPEGDGSPGFIEVEAGTFEMGLNVGSGLWGSSYDCEAPAHQAKTDQYQIGEYPVTNGEFLAFLESGAYEEPKWWTEDGQKWLKTESHHAPLDWHQIDGKWHRRNLLGTRPIRNDDKEILTHITHFEATAFAKWSDARLPTEAEWEKAARFDPETGTSLRNPVGNRFARPGKDANCDVMGWSPSTIGAFDHAASPLGMKQSLGEVWEWSGDLFHGYPGFEPFPYEDYAQTWYNAGQYSLRGGSWASRPSCATATFRNWDLPNRRQIHVGLRLARD